MIENRDVISKTFAVLVILMLGMVAVCLAQRVPGGQVLSEEKDHHVLDEEGDRLFSIYEGREEPPVLGLSYHLPGATYPDRPEHFDLEFLREAGLLKGYCLPPNSLAFKPDGEHLVLPGPPFPTEPRSPSVIFRGNTQNPRIALTFDTTEVTEPGVSAVVDELTRLRVPATFFVCGGFCQKNPELLKMIKERGFEVASHSFSHPAFTKISDGQIVDQLRGTEQAAVEAAGVRMAAYFRPPYGDYDARVAQMVGQCGYLAVMWNRDTMDWHPATVGSQIRDRATAYAANGDIVLMHTNGKYTVAMLEEIVNNLRDKGFELTTVSGVLQP